MTLPLYRQRRNHLMAMLATPALVGTLCAISALSARAQTVTLNYSGAVINNTTTNRSYTYGDNQSFVSLTNSYNSVQASLTNASIYAGSFTLTATPALPGVPNPFSGYCIQLGTPITNGQSATVQTLNSSFNLGKASTVSANFGGAIAYLFNNNAPDITDQSQTAADRSAALQLSIWEVEYNWNGTGLSGIDTTLQTGNFTYVGNTLAGNDATTATIRSLSSAMLTSWNGQTDTATWLNSYSPDPSVSRQSVVTTRITGNAAAPEPGALALLLGPLGIAGTALARRRRVA